jgi:hypothetical protein
MIERSDTISRNNRTLDARLISPRSRRAPVPADHRLVGLHLTDGALRMLVVLHFS